MKILVNGELVDSGQPMPATGSGLPMPKLPPTAAEVDPTPANPGPCPCCGRERPNLVNSFATTGERAPLGSYDVEA